MEKLVFTCPTTGQRVDVGIETELQTLLRIRASRLRTHCPACEQSHEWPVAEAHLAKKAA